MKKTYLKPVLEVYKTITESLLNTDTTGHHTGDEFTAKENIFTFDDEFGDTWGTDDPNNLWGDEE